MKEIKRNITKPEDNDRYPDSIRNNGALRAMYDNCGEDEEKAIALHEAVMASRMDGFRNNPIKEKRIKKALHKLLNDTNEVDRFYKIVVEQEEY